MKRRPFLQTTVTAITLLIGLTMLFCYGATPAFFHTADSRIFTCAIDSLPFKASLAVATVEDELSDGVLQLLATDEKNRISIELILRDLEAQSGKTILAEGGIFFEATGRTYMIDPKEQAKVHITARTGNKVSGTFSFMAYEDLYHAGQSMVSVTEGRFEVEIGE